MNTSLASPWQETRQIWGRLSTLEARDDMQIRTLRRIGRALGADLALVAHLPAGDIRGSQFED